MTAAAFSALLVLSTGSVAAATGPAPDGTFTQNGKSADASSGGCVSNENGTSTCSFVGISVFAGKMSDNFSGVTHANQVCVWMDRYTASDATGALVGDPVSEAGCKADLPNGTIVFGSKLTAVTLATTTISIQQMVCVDWSVSTRSPASRTRAVT